MDAFVKGLAWVGTRTEHYEKMVAFYRDTLRLPLDYEEGEFAIFKLADGSKAEVFAPPTLSTPTSPRDRSSGSSSTTSGVPASSWRQMASSLSAPSTCGNPRGRHGRTFGLRTATSAR